MAKVVAESNPPLNKTIAFSPAILPLPQMLNSQLYQNVHNNVILCFEPVIVKNNWLISKKHNTCNVFVLIIA